jgi:hypothetical protein
VASESLNTVWSISGTPAPTSLFEASETAIPDDYYGFEWPISNFTWVDPSGQERISAVWKILGKQTQVESAKDDVVFCAGGGAVGNCSLMPTKSTQTIISQAASTVFAISRAVTKAKVTKAWRSSSTSFRTTYQSRAAKALRNINTILRNLPVSRYICPNVAPPPCKDATFPKGALASEFESIFRVKLPKGLKEISKLYPKERQAFMNELKKHPDTYTYCEQ